jgi:Amt family ammonium transporter
MRSMWLKVALAVLVGVVAGCPSMVGMKVHAQTPLPAMMLVAPDVPGAPVSAEARIAQLEKQVAAQTAAIATAQTSGDNAWMLVSAALVLLMTGPGLALFYGGLVRKKNVLGTMMQSFAMMAVVTCYLGDLVTYSLAFRQRERVYRRAAQSVSARGVTLDAERTYAPTIPIADVHGLSVDVRDHYAGADYGRVCRADEVFSAMLVFMVLWTIVVYSPMAHMVWGVGGLLNSGAGTFRASTLPGGTVVHVTSGVSALVTALYLGKRIGYPKEAMQPHSVVLSFIGACLLWVGWFGFNAGSALGRDAGDFGVCGDSLWRRRRRRWDGARLRSGWRNGKPIGAGRDLGRGGGTGGDYAGVGVCVSPFRHLLIGLIAGAFCFVHGI